MAQKKPPKFLVFMALFLLWAQAIASPFLMCLDMPEALTGTAMSTSMDSTMNSAMMEHCTGMRMPPTSGMDAADVDAATDAATMEGASPAYPLDEGLGVTTLNCDLLCQYCRRAETPDVVAIVVLDALLLLVWSPSSFVPSPEAQPPGDHFRPPPTA